MYIRHLFELIHNGYIQGLYHRIQMLRGFKALHSLPQNIADPCFRIQAMLNIL